MLLEVKNLHKRFNDKEILKGIDFSIDSGEVVVIIGPSGSGKTTLLRNLNFLESADQGTLWLQDQQINLAKPTKHTNLVLDDYSTE